MPVCALVPKLALSGRNEVVPTDTEKQEEVGVMNQIKARREALRL